MDDGALGDVLGLREWIIGAVAIVSVKLTHRMLSRGEKRSVLQPAMDVVAWPAYVGLLLFLGVHFAWKFATDGRFRSEFRKGVRPRS